VGVVSVLPTIYLQKSRKTGLLSVNSIEVIRSNEGILTIRVEMKFEVVDFINDVLGDVSV